MKSGTASPANSSAVGCLGASTVTSGNGDDEFVCAKAAETLTSEMAAASSEEHSAAESAIRRAAVDGSILEVTRSSNVTYSSSNTAVATVDANGIVTGGSAGTATITATYTLSGQSVTTAVPVTVPPPWFVPSHRGERTRLALIELPVSKGARDPVDRA